jgi:hypothetical protein
VYVPNFLLEILVLVQVAMAYEYMNPAPMVFQVAIFV